DARSEHLRSYDLMSEATPSQHLWRAALATELSEGKHQVEVRAKLNDEWFIDSLTYQLQSAEP
ncbi:MAG: calcineurin phosphoesterase, partial [Arenimonas sp.]